MGRGAVEVKNVLPHWQQQLCTRGLFVKEAGFLLKIA